MNNHTSSLAPIFSRQSANGTLANSTQSANATNLALSSSIVCYDLPYGGIGFASHVLTYYTILVLGFGRRPLRPWSNLERPKLNAWLASLKLIITIIGSAVTMAECRKTWQFLVMAAWKLDLSLTFGIVSLHSTYRLRQKEGDGTPKSPQRVLTWLFLYVPGVGTGMAGLFSLVSETYQSNHRVVVITQVFGATFGALSLVGGYLFVKNWTLIILWWVGWDQDEEEGSQELESREESRRWEREYRQSRPAGLVCKEYSAQAFIGAICMGFVVFSTFGALYSDWILGSIADNMVGYPSHDAYAGRKALWWFYVLGKRLTLFSD